jgi:heme exporter protein B
VIASVAGAVAGKDLRVEVRSRNAASSVMPFAVTMLLAFGFALGPDRPLLAQTASGLLWLAATFAAVDLFHRSYRMETDGGALDALLLAPGAAGAVYLGKAIAAALQLWLLVLATGLLVGLLFGLPLGRAPVLLVLTATLGVIGLSAIGSLFGLLSVMGRRQAALPALVLPLVTPVLIAATRATDAAVHGDSAQAVGWLGVLTAFDAAFLASGYLVYGHLLED